MTVILDWKLDPADEVLTPVRAPLLLNVRAKKASVADTDVGKWFEPENEPDTFNLQEEPVKLPSPSVAGPPVILIAVEPFRLLVVQALGCPM